MNKILSDYEVAQLLAGLSNDSYHKQCPFCGAQSQKLAVIELDSGYVVKCSQCGIIGPLGATQKEAAEKWNKRGEEMKVVGELMQPKTNINIIRKGFAEVPEEVHKCPVCGEYQRYYVLRDKVEVNGVSSIFLNEVQKYPTFECRKCQTIWQYMGEETE